ncbi:phage integrase SAM-like domain-containing protein [Ferruginibacter paludis]|uniref:site-specific integrase n=1 Tax=Ferruginibacter paludis TaxID=1310417 RepID=UPI0025B4F9B4|nr:site-specific integrase [Ferruginibacter paludis]MDN3654368.1 phage integrase SAM-like domain-containing protein [Ferruginibacter paludis]
MPDATFVLKEPNSSEPTLIYLFFRFNKQKLKYSTSEKIKPKYWNDEKQRAKETRSFPNYASLNNTLDNLARTVKDAHSDLIREKRAPTPFKLKDALDKSLYKEDYGQKTTFLKFVELLIKDSNRKPNTIKKWQQTLNKLVEFKNATQTEVDFDTINMEFYNRFIQYLNKKGYTQTVSRRGQENVITKKNYAMNTIGGFIKAIKIFMNEAVDRNMTKNLEYRNRNFKVTDEEVDKIYLSQTEILNIYKIDFTNDKRLEKVRDLFVVGCYTGLRFSDLIEVRPENIINGGSQIKIRTEKTSEIVVIPLHKFVKEIILKYNGSLPPVISNQKMNKYLKEIGEIAGIDNTLSIAITRGGKTENNSFSKFDLITTHTARRSFATNAYLMDVPSISIMKITGHTTERSFMKYIKISQEDNANKLINHPFFN